MLLGDLISLASLSTGDPIRPMASEELVQSGMEDEGPRRDKSCWAPAVCERTAGTLLARWRKRDFSLVDSICSMVKDILVRATAGSCGVCEVCRKEGERWKDDLETVRPTHCFDPPPPIAEPLRAQRLLVPLLPDADIWQWQPPL